MSLKHYTRVIRKDPKLIMLIVVFIILAIFATVIADKLNLIPDEPADKNPSLLVPNY